MHRVLVVGFARSGTTLLQAFLASHPSLAGLTESHYFFDNWVCPMDRLDVPERLADRLCLPRPGSRRWSPSDWQTYFTENGLDRVRPPTGAGRLARPGLAFIDALDRTARARGLEGWVEKSTLHLRRVPLLRRACPDARYVHIFRRFPAVWASFVNAARSHPEGGFDIAEAAVLRNWSRDLARTARLAVEDPEHHLAIDYVALCERTGDTLAAIERFLGLTEGSLGRRDLEGTDSIVRQGEGWKGNVFGAVRAARPIDLPDPAGGDEERAYAAAVEATRRGRGHATRET